MKVKYFERWAKRGMAVLVAGALLTGGVVPVGTIISRAEQAEEVDEQHIATSDAASLQFTQKHIVSDLSRPTAGALGSSII